MKGTHITETQIGERTLLQALWQSFPERVCPPFSSYCCNCIESFWSVVDIGMQDKPKSMDVLDEVKFIERAIKAWMAKKTFSDVQPGISNGSPSETPASRPCQSLLHGRGSLSENDPCFAHDKKKQYRRLSTQGIIQMVQEGGYHIAMVAPNNFKLFLCPKYDGGDFDNYQYRVIFEALCSHENLASREEAWEALGIRTGSGPADFDITQILYYSRHYTLLTVAADGTFVESHAHYIVDGQTEHSLWLQHELTYVDHSPAAPVHVRRTGRVRRRTGLSRAPCIP